MNRDREFTKSGSLAALLGIGTLGHLGANLGFKGGRAAGKFARTKAPALRQAGKLKAHERAIAGVGEEFNKSQSEAVASSINEALSGRVPSLKQRLGETWVAPEFWGGRHVGKSLGENLRTMSKGRRYRTLKKLRKRLAQNPEFTNEAPWASHLQSGVDKALRRGLEKKGPVRKPSRLSNLAVAAPAIPAAVFEPGALAHMGVNRTRLALANSRIGKAVQEKQLYSGLGRATDVPEHLSRKARVGNELTDYLVSPAVRDASKWSERLVELSKKDPIAARQLSGALEGSFTEGLGTLGQISKRAKDAEKAEAAGKMGLFQKLRGYAPEGLAQRKARELAKDVTPKNRGRLEEVAKMYRNYPKTGRMVEPSRASEILSSELKQVPRQHPPMPATRINKLRKRVRGLLSREPKTYKYAPAPATGTMLRGS